MPTRNWGSAPPPRPYPPLPDVSEVSPPEREVSGNLHVSDGFAVILSGFTVITIAIICATICIVTYIQKGC